ncbi:MAG: hypothetical protein QME60_07225 [Verrucomicrobiota bacterium]|nr:hypothetical protein [Verrucomicrobiota bacterium]
MKIALVVLLGAVTLGCGGQSREVVEAATGKTAVDQYLKTKEQIHDINAKQKERYQEIPR